MSLLAAVTCFLRETRISPTRFGREAVRDPQFVFDLRRGRAPRAAVTRRVIAYMSAKRKLEDGRCAR